MLTGKALTILPHHAVTQ